MKNGKKADVLITVKESLANGHRIYSIELDEINKASERFEGLSDAAANVANRATKTPHIDGLNLTQKNSDVNNMSHGLDFPNGKSGGNKRICSCLTTLTFKKRRPLGLSKSAC